MRLRLFTALTFLFLCILLSFLVFSLLLGPACQTTRVAPTTPSGNRDTYRELSESVLDRHLDDLEDRLGLPGQVTGSAVVIDPKSRRVIIKISDRRAREKGIDRAGELRQAGSSFKTILIAAALESGDYTPDTELRMCPPAAAPQPEAGRWKPKNYESAGDEKITLRRALKRSHSTASVKILSCITPKRAVATARAIGIRSKLQTEFEIAFGSARVSLVELTNCYATFAAGGMYAQPDSALPPVRALSEKDAQAVTSMLLDSGPSRSFAIKVGHAVDGKTAWCIGYRVGNDMKVSGAVIGVRVGISEANLTGAQSSFMIRTVRSLWIRLATARHDKQ